MPLPTLICPACRGLRPDGRFHAAALVPVDLGHRCPACGALHPTVDGVPIVLRDVDAWLKDELPLVMSRQDLPEELSSLLCRRAGGALGRSWRRREVYRELADSPLHARLAALLPTLPGPVLELGAGTGAHGCAHVVAVDLDWLLLRDHPGQAVLADALDPPFEAHSFGAVVATNLLDSCRDPALLLGQMDALLRPGGTLLVTSPLAWDPGVTPPAAWMQEADVDAFFAQRGYAVVREQHAWSLRQGPRTTTTHEALLWWATQPGPAHG